LTHWSEGLPQIYIPIPDGAKEIHPICSPEEFKWCRHIWSTKPCPLAGSDGCVVLGLWQVGGSKISSKITVIESLMNVCDKVILGGGMVFTFFKADGKSVGSSLVEDDSLDLAKKLTELAKSKGVELILPNDVLCADKFAADANTQVCSASSIPDGKFTSLSHITRDGSACLPSFQLRIGGSTDVETSSSVYTYQ